MSRLSEEDYVGRVVSSVPRRRRFDGESANQYSTPAAYTPDPPIPVSRFNV
jgi:hypothetical protein